MPQHHTTGDQVTFVGEWFASWSELQRADFLPSLIKRLRPENQINGDLVDNLGALNIASSSNRPPSIFHCQVKLFHDWVGTWSDEEREKLLSLFGQSDPEFVESLKKKLANSPEARPEEAAVPQNEPGENNIVEEAAAAPVAEVAPAAEVNGAVAAVVDNDRDEAIESSSSSTLSSPRPNERHQDSGLDSPAVVEDQDEGGHAVDMAEVVGAVAIQVRQNNEDGTIAQ